MGLSRLKQFALASSILAAGLLAAGSAAAEALRVGTWGLPPGLGNPYTGRGTPSIFVWDALFDPLVRIGEDGSAVPVLAESWENIDGTTWRLTLRQGITFSDGSPFDADDVVATFAYLASDHGRASSVGGEVRDIVSVTRVDDFTVDVTTAGPDPVLPNKLALVYIIAGDVWEALGPDGFAQTPVGTGSFTVESWGTNEVTLTANTTSWRAPSIETLVVLSLPERPSRLQALLSGQIDVGFGFSPDNIGQLESAGLLVVSTPAPQVMSLAFANTAHPDSPFNDVRVREAANLAVNRQAIADVLLAGLGAAAGQGGTPAAFGYDPEIPPFPYDPERARALMAEAGHAGGINVTAHVVVGSFPADSDIYQQAVIDMAEVGINVELQQIRFPEWLDHFLNNTWPGELFGSSWNTAPYMDSIRPYTYMTCMKPNASFCEEVMTPVIDSTYRTFDPEERRELLHELHRLTNEVLPSIWLVEQIDVSAWRPEIEGLGYINRAVYYENVTIGD